MEISQSLKTVMKRLKLSGLLAMLPDRVAYARKAKLSELELLELALQDEVDRRDQKNLSSRIAPQASRRSRPSRASTGTHP